MIKKAIQEEKGAGSDRRAKVMIENQEERSIPRRFFPLFTTLCQDEASTTLTAFRV